MLASFVGALPYFVIPVPLSSVVRLLSSVFCHLSSVILEGVPATEGSFR